MLFMALVFSTNSTETAIKCKKTAENLKLIYFHDLHDRIDGFYGES